MLIYIIRHADPDYPNNTITPAGHEEAKALARRLAGDGLTHIYTSPLGRARDTAQYTADLAKLEPVVEDWLLEHGELKTEVTLRTGGTARYVAWDVHGETIRAQSPLPTHDDWHMHPAIPPETVAVYADVQAAADQFSAQHGYEREGERYRIVRPNEDRIAFFCHNGTGLLLLAHWLALPVSLVWIGFWLPPSSVTTVLFEERSDQLAVPRCLGVGDVSHLYEARLPVRPRGLKGNTR